MDDFEKVLKDFEPLIYHLIHKYQIRDLEGEFYQEGTIALWRAYNQHDPERSKLSTYAYYSISRCFLNKMAKENRNQDNLQKWLVRVSYHDLLIEDEYDMDEGLMLEIQNLLSVNQWNWFVTFVLQDQSVRSIAQVHGVSENAVKNWGKLARKKLRILLTEREYVE